MFCFVCVACLIERLCSFRCRPLLQCVCPHSGGAYGGVQPLGPQEQAGSQCVCCSPPFCLLMYVVYIDVDSHYSLHTGGFTLMHVITSHTLHIHTCMQGDCVSNCVAALARLAGGDAAGPETGWPPGAHHAKAFLRHAASAPPEAGLHAMEGTFLETLLGRGELFEPELISALVSVTAATWVYRRSTFIFSLCCGCAGGAQHSGGCCARASPPLCFRRSTRDVLRC